VDVVGGDEFHAKFFRQARHAFADDGFALEPMVLYFQIHVVAEDFLELQGDIRRVVIPDGEVGRHHASGAGREGDQSFRMPAQQFPVDARLVVEAFGMSERGQLEQVVIAGLVFRQQHEMVVAMALALGMCLGGIAVEARTAGDHIHLVADDGFMPAAFALR
jgi:hypothetical protein